MATKSQQFHRYQDDDNIAAEHVEQGHLPPSAHVREEAFVGAHMSGRFGREQHISNEETRTVVLTEFVSLEDLERGNVRIAIGEKQADLFRRESINPETGKITHAGNHQRSQITRVVLTSYKFELPVDAGLAFSSTSGELSRKSSQLKGTRNGRTYAVVVSRESACDYSLVKGQKRDGVLIYSNDSLIDEKLVEKYGNVDKSAIRAGLTVHPSDPSIQLFEFKKNPLLTDLLKRHHLALEERFESFSYEALKHEANVLGHDTVQIPSEVVDHLENQVNTHAIGAIEEGTGPLSKAAIVLESPTSEDGSFKDARKIIKGKTGLDSAGVDQLMHLKHQVDFELVISAVIPGAAAP